MDKAGSGIRLDGVARVDVEDFRVLLTRDPNSAVLLLSGGRSTDELDVRVGDAFALGHAGGVPVAYQLLAISGDSASLRRELLIDQRAAGMGIRRETSVVRVRSYRPD